MNRNQKIALGCGGAGCLGLIVVVIAGGLIYFLSVRGPSLTNRNVNYNVSTNRNSNLNTNSDDNLNANDNSSPSISSAAASMSSDEKHKLYQAAMMTGDTELLQRVSVRLGLMEDDFTRGATHEAFVEEHVTWAISNTDFILSLNTAEKARAYVNSNFPE